VGPARALIHNFKYRGIEPAGRFLAEAMAEMVPPGVDLVPLPRVEWRLIRYGIDPALGLARQLGTLTGSPVVHLLRPATFGPHQASRPRSRRGRPVFALRRPPERDLILIDDVLTTGATIEGARMALGAAVTGALTATASPGD
jgi:predicted amidophosphoribosyltransferase